MYKNDTRENVFANNLNNNSNNSLGLKKSPQTIVEVNTGNSNKNSMSNFNNNGSANNYFSSSSGINQINSITSTNKTKNILNNEIKEKTKKSLASNSNTNLNAYGSNTIKKNPVSNSQKEYK